MGKSWKRLYEAFISFSIFHSADLKAVLKASWVTRRLQLPMLSHFRPMSHLRTNQVVGFTSKMFEKHLWKREILSKYAGH